MRIGVTISRDWDEDDFDTIIEALYDACEEISFHKVTVVHGASQMDFFIAGMARALGMDTEPNKADWRPAGTFNKYAGFARNQKMVDKGADIWLAFIKDGSSGATDCADRAEDAGIPTKRFRS